jgi:orotidine-5'-phosphate decarboxylase
MIRNPIICAIDENNFDVAADLIKEVNLYVGAIKLGLEFFMAFGLDGILRIIDLFPEIKIFLDLKFHDIPNTVVGALKSVVKIKNVFMTTIHAIGGDEMISRASEFVRNENPDLKLICVTNLTSLKMNEQKVIDLTGIALKNGASGVVCPGGMTRILRDNFASQYGDFLIVNPGIRFKDSSVRNDDQESIMTPDIALKNRASYLVIGRPITRAENKVDVLKNLIGLIKG